MRDRDVQISRPSPRTNGYRVPFLTPTPSILAKRTISEDCTQGPESERSRKYHCLRKEAERRAIPRLDHLMKPAAGLSTGLSSARPFTTSVKPLNPLSIPGDTNPDLAPSPLPPPSRIGELPNGYEEGWVHLDSILKSAPIDTSSGLPSDLPQQPVKKKYRCRLCSLEERREMKNKGVFKRHIRDKHYPDFLYYCDKCDPPGTTKFRRKDKFQGHMRNTHSRLTLTKDRLASVTEYLNPPLTCALCPGRVNTWDEFFECLCRHCHISEEDTGERDLGRDYRAGDVLGPQEHLLPQPSYGQNCTISCPARL